jgi:hypothetical protein
MKKILQLLVATAGILGASMALSCEYPARTDVPDGNTATKDEMVAGQRSVKSYMAAMEEYLSCIETAEQETIAGGDLDEDAKQQRIAMFNKKYNAAVEAMNLIAEQFNAQVRAYKDRSQ